MASSKHEPSRKKQKMWDQKIDLDKLFGLLEVIKESNVQTYGPLKKLEWWEETNNYLSDVKTYGLFKFDPFSGDEEEQDIDNNYQIEFKLDMKAYETKNCTYEVGTYSFGKMAEVEVDDFKKTLNIKFDVYDIIKWVNVFGLIYYVGSNKCSIDTFVGEFCGYCGLWPDCREVNCILGREYDQEFAKQTAKFPFIIDELITFGYCRKNGDGDDDNVEIPEGIFKMVLEYYHNDEWFCK